MTKAKDVKSALTVVRDWADENKNHQAWRQFHIDVKNVLPDAKEMDSPNDILQEVQNLRTFRDKVSEGKAAYLTLDTTVQSKPKELCYSLIRHWMQLFDVRDMEGVLPCMNMVFGKYNELRNFWKSLCVELRLDSSTSMTMVLQRLSSV